MIHHSSKKEQPSEEIISWVRAPSGTIILWGGDISKPRPLQRAGQRVDKGNAYRQIAQIKFYSIFFKKSQVQGSALCRLGMTCGQTFRRARNPAPPRPVVYQQRQKGALTRKNGVRPAGGAAVILAARHSCSFPLQGKAKSLFTASVHSPGSSETPHPLPDPSGW